MNLQVMESFCQLYHLILRGPRVHISTIFLVAPASEIFLISLCDSHTQEKTLYTYKMVKGDNAAQRSI